MDMVRALLGLFNLGARFADFRLRVARATRTGVLVVTLISLALTISFIGICVLIYALDRALVPHLGEVWSALLLAALLLGTAGMMLFNVSVLLKRPPPAPVVVATAQPEEMSTAALLALLGGIVVGTVMHARKDGKL